MISVTIFAQEQNEPELLPFDQYCRKGTLPNGFTYYLRHQEAPSKCASYYFVQKSGSLEEDDDQNGLAHFVEHMCFNGSKHFPGNGMNKWIQKVGISKDSYNAYTSYSKIYYRFDDILCQKENVEDTLLLIMHDWATDLTFSPDEVDNERNVVIEEIRQLDADHRKKLASGQALIPNSRYQQRDVLGSPEQIKTFKRQRLLDYYNDWFRPDLQAVIIVGDIDVDRLEKKIQERFADLEMPANPKPLVERETWVQTEQPIFYIHHDPEYTDKSAALLFRNANLWPDYAKSRVDYLAQSMMREAIGYMLDQRIQKIAADPNGPFSSAGAMLQDDYLIKDNQTCFILFSEPKNMQFQACVDILFREAQRVARHGFTAEEYDKFKSVEHLHLENYYNTSHQTPSKGIAQMYMNNFLFGNECIDPEQDANVRANLRSQITLEHVNNMASDMFLPIQMSVMAAGSKENEISEEGLLASIQQVFNEDITPYETGKSIESLVPQLPPAGKVVSEKVDENLGIVEWKLSNGVTVVAKPTSYVNDQVMFAAYAKGGISTIAPADDDNFAGLAIGINSIGVGDLTAYDLTSYLSGTKVNVSYGLTENSTVIAGNSVCSTFPLLLETIHAFFTNPSLDKAAYESNLKQAIEQKKQDEATPMDAFRVKAKEFFFETKRDQDFTAQRFANANTERVEELIKNLYVGKAGDFRMVFSGYFNTDSLKPYIEKYIGSIPVKKSAPAKVYPKRLRKGTDQLVFKHKMEVPQDVLGIQMFSHPVLSPKTIAMANIFAKVASARLSEEIREKMGAVYTIGMSLDLDVTDSEPFQYSITTPLKPELSAEAIAAIKRILNDLGDTFTEQELASAKEAWKSDVYQSVTDNNTWAHVLAREIVVPNVNPFAGGEDFYTEGITLKDMKDFIKSTMKENNYRVILMQPE